MRQLGLENSTGRPEESPEGHKRGSVELILSQGLSPFLAQLELSRAPGVRLDAAEGPWRTHTSPGPLSLFRCERVAAVRAFQGMRAQRNPQAWENPVEKAPLSVDAQMTSVDQQVISRNFPENPCADNLASNRTSPRHFERGGGTGRKPGPDHGATRDPQAGQPAVDASDEAAGTRRFGRRTGSVTRRSPRRALWNSYFRRALRPFLAAPASALTRWAHAPDPRRPCRRAGRARA
jgi:hypothetical protein